MGEEFVRMRFTKEQILLERMAPVFQSPTGMADRRWPVRFLENAVRWSGLGSRARKNFLTIQRIEREWELPGLAANLDGFRLLHLSDFHLDFDPELIGRLREALGDWEYDVVCLTGDFFDLVFEEKAVDEVILGDLLSLFSGPVYAVLGNHDIFRVGEVLEGLGVRVLMNESGILGGPSGNLTLAGVDDPRLYKTSSVNNALKGAKSGGPTILLAHSPQIFEEAAAGDVDLVLCGHTHGGQVSLPGQFSLASSSDCPRKMVSRDWYFKGMHGYTSHGCGGCKLPFRFNAPAEITLHTLRTAEAKT